MKKPSKNGHRKVPTNIRLDPGLKKWAQSFAKKEDVTFTEILERALDHMREAANGR